MMTLAWAVVALVAVVLAYRVALLHAARLDQSAALTKLRADYDRHAAMVLESFKVVDRRLGEVELILKDEK